LRAGEDLCFEDAVTLARMLRARVLSSAELLEAFLSRIERVNPLLNALVSLVPEQAIATARALDEDAAHGRWRGPLHGLPVAVKDLAPTLGIRTTWGSPIFRDFVPGHDALFVERLRRAGAIVIGKTNTPEFGAGSQTFNRVFGPTRNPYDLGKSPGGSSGGAAAALAARLLPLADGSDLGGSIRNPAGFCHVFGLRPSPGRVPHWPSELGFSGLGVIGPMARTVPDAALLLSVLAGPDPRDPLALETPGTRFLEPLERDFRGVRVAWSPDLGRFPVTAEVIATCRAALAHFQTIGCELEPDCHPDFDGAERAFHALRAAAFEVSVGHWVDRHPQLVKDTLHWNVEQARKLRACDIARAEQARSALYQRVVGFLEDYEFLICPTAQVAPFPVEIEWIRQIDETPCESYVDWMMICCVVSLTGLPVAAVPAGLTATGGPIGLQIIGRPRADFEVLRLAYAYQQASGFPTRMPAV
jgi:amidase